MVMFFLATNKKTKKIFAVKVMTTENMNEKMLLYFIREIEVISQLNNYFLLHFTGLSMKPPYTIVTDYVSNGTLSSAIRHKKNAPTISPTQKTKIAIGIAYGMKYLHQCDIIHRDLKSANILLNDKLLPVICDFGISRFHEQTLVTRGIGTPHWMAPEMYSSTEYTKKVDVYAFAIILWEMLTEAIPYKGMKPQQILQEVNAGRRPELPYITPKELKTLVETCWHENPKIRPNFDQIIEVFKSGRVCYEGTSVREVNKMFDFIKKLEKTNKKAVNPHPIIEVKHKKASNHHKHSSHEKGNSLPQTANEHEKPISESENSDDSWKLQAQPKAPPITPISSSMSIPDLRLPLQRAAENHTSSQELKPFSSSGNGLNIAVDIPAPIEFEGKPHKDKSILQPQGDDSYEYYSAE